MIEYCIIKVRVTWVYLAMMGIYLFTFTSLFVGWMFVGKRRSYHWTLYQLGRLQEWINREGRYAGMRLERNGRGNPPANARLVGPP